MKHKCQNFSTCGNYIRHGQLCDECRKNAKKLEGTWQTIEAELVPPGRFAAEPQKDKK